LVVVGGGNLDSSNVLGLDVLTFGPGFGVVGVLEEAGDLVFVGGAVLELVLKLQGRKRLAGVL
jgi:hypothetical protein